MTFLDFFAGIGTIRIGFEQAGWTCNGHVEWDKYAQKSYNAMHEIKDGEYCGWDIRAVRATELPRSDLWTFGAPCQDFSIAGNRKGMDGERSSLVNEIFRLIEETPEEDRPQWLLYENVKGMLSSNGGWDFLGIILEMDRLGYDVEWQLLNSKHFGVPQNRERVFTIGHLRGRCGRKVFPVTGQSGETYESDGMKFLNHLTYSKLAKSDTCRTLKARDYKGPAMVVIDDQGRIKESYKKHDIVPTLRAQTHGNPPKVILYDRKNGIGDEIEVAHSLNSTDWRGLNRNQTKSAVALQQSDKIRIRKLTPLECWRLQGVPDEYFHKAKAAGVSDSQLYKQAGNACTVNVMYAIAMAMKGN